MVVSGTEKDGIDMNRAVFDELSGAGVSIRRMNNVHDKFFLAYGLFGTTMQYRVYTGSQNWTQDALSENDEIFVKMGPETGSSHPLYDAYYAHFNDSYDIGVPCTAATSPAPEPPGVAP
jgi:phosphatidylserine/phosphatidylglycerophosphate/cardiolipin synthase-like enzyme